MRIVGEKIFYEWEDYQKDVEELTRRIQEVKKDIDYIFGIPRGGLVIGVSLSHLLSVPLMLNIVNLTERSVVVDDIVDTGASMERLLKVISVRPCVASLYYAPSAFIRPDFWIREKERWVVFPWETEGTSRYDN